MDKVGRPIGIQHVPVFLEPASGSGFREFFSREDETNILSLVVDRHAIRERILSDDPPDVYPQFLINPSSRHIESLVAERFDHSEQFCLSDFARGLREKAYDSWHSPLSPK